MKLIKFELLKIRKNNFFIITLIVFLCILFVCCFAYFSNSQDFLAEQRTEARVMSDRISEDVSSDENLIKERDLYRKLSYVDTWQEAYEVLNEIDQLFINAPYIVEKNKSDLDYDNATNIEIRNYQIEHNISPDDKSGELFMIKVFDDIMNYLIPIFLCIISVYVFAMEYEDKTMTYLYTLNYRRSHIVISKWIAACISSIVIIVLPLCVVYLVASMMYGFSNPNVLIGTSKQLAQITINNYGFITIGDALLYVIFIIGLNISLFASLASFFTTIFKNYLLIFSAMGMMILIGLYMNVLTPITKVLTSTIDFQIQWMMGVVVSIFTLYSAIKYMNKRSVL